MNSSTITHQDQFSILLSGTGWKIIAQREHEQYGDGLLSGHLAQYSWNLIDRMVKPITTLDRFFEILEHERELFLETNRNDSRLIFRKVLLTKRKTNPRKIYKIEIGGGIECVATIFQPIRKYIKK